MSSFLQPGSSMSSRYLPSFSVMSVFIAMSFRVLKIGEVNISSNTVSNRSFVLGKNFISIASCNVSSYVCTYMKSFHRGSPDYSSYYSRYFSTVKSRVLKNRHPPVLCLSLSFVFILPDTERPSTARWPFAACFSGVFPIIRRGAAERQTCSGSTENR